MRRELFAPDWVAISGEGDDRCDVTTLSRIPAATPVFVAAGNRALGTRLTGTSLRVIEVPPSVPVTVDRAGSELRFLTDGSSDVSNPSLHVRMDDVSLLVPSSTVEPERFEDLGPGAGPLDVLLVVVARVSRDPLCEELALPALLRRSAAVRAAAVDHACDLARTTDARVVLPYGGPPCFLDPELAHLNRWIDPPGVLPHVEQAVELLRPRLPGRLVTSLLPGDRLFPSDGLVVDDARRHDFSFDDLSGYLHEYAYRRALELSRLHTRFLAPREPLGPPFKAMMEATFAKVGTETDHLRFEVTGSAGGEWDVILDAGRMHVDLSGRASAPRGRIRIASRWLAPVIDGRATWQQLLRSLRYTLSRATGRVGDPLLELLEHPARSARAGTAAGPGSR